MIADTSFVRVGEEVADVKKVWVAQAEPKIDDGSASKKYSRGFECMMEVSIRQQCSVLFSGENNASAIINVTVQLEYKIKGTCLDYFRRLGQLSIYDDSKVAVRAPASETVFNQMIVISSNEAPRPKRDEPTMNFVGRCDRDATRLMQKFADLIGCQPVKTVASSLE